MIYVVLVKYCIILQVIPKTGINVVSVMLHSHTAARKLRLLHIRSGKELTPLAEASIRHINLKVEMSLSPQNMSFLHYCSLPLIFSNQLILLLSQIRNADQSTAGFLYPINLTIISFRELSRFIVYFMLLNAMH